MITTEYPSILKVKDIQNILRIGQRQTYDLVKTEDFKTIRLGNRHLYSKEHFIKWLEGKGK
ncbi:helix-turn-helix domain-containing protein [Peribacillus frigoritolerans]|uniref:helix-turn-helix domain-containing protein n=1 Tax=Peribacillus TaxID=2675229 RepID=UPI002556C2A5|nr:MULTISPECIES: helix-turn-helix domain-containing protein [Peribacillus]MDR4927225.1 helix-turn-helix domain-containing protein [Peribacillus simplex]MED4632882.1 helix-turn-helix domain-containing protein [Peribacillus frigoritolerans]